MPAEKDGAPLAQDGASSQDDLVRLDPLVRSIGVPKAGLPSVPELIDGIRSQVEAAGHTVSDQVWQALRQRVENNYRYMVGDPQAPAGTWGMQVPLGPVEALIRLNPTDPRKVRGPSASGTGDQAPGPNPDDATSRAEGAVNAVYATGPKTQTRSGQTGAARGAVSATVGLVPLPGTAQPVRVGAGVSGTANQNDRTTSHVWDVETGRSETDKSDFTPVSYAPGWSYLLRSKSDQPWAETDEHRLEDPGTERLLLWVPDHYLRQTRSAQVTADDVGERARQLPRTYYASGFTALPAVFEEIVAKLESEGLDLPVGGSTRDELTQKLWNLDAHLDRAVNDARGYSFLLHDAHGRPVADVKLHSRRLKAERVGETSDKAQIENTRAAVDGFSGSHTLANSSTVTPVLASAGFEPVPGVGLGMAPAVSASVTRTNSDGVIAGRDALKVDGQVYAGLTVGYGLGLEHVAKISVRGREKAVETAPVPDQALVRLPEPDAFAYGFPVDRDALKTDPGPLDRVPFTQDAVRGTGRRPGDPETKPVPAHIAKGKGIGMGVVQVDQQTEDRISGYLQRELGSKGFLPPDQEHPFGGRSWWQHGNELDSMLDNRERLTEIVRGLGVNYDQIHQDGLTFTLHRRTGFAGIDADVDSAQVTISAKKSETDPPRFVRTTDEYRTVNMAAGMGRAGLSTSGGKKASIGVKLRAMFGPLRSGVVGVELHRGVGASQFVNFRNSRPKLVNYEGPVDQFDLASDYEIKIKYQHSGVQGRVRPGVRDPKPLTLERQHAQAFVLPFSYEDGPVSAKRTSPEVLDQAIVSHLDVTGAREAATRGLKDFTGPAGAADQELNSFAGTTAMRSYVREILRGAYTSDQPFKARWTRDVFGAVDARGTMGPSQYIGATDKPLSVSDIQLWLAEAGTSHTVSSGLTWNQAEVQLGGEAGGGTIAGGVFANHTWEHKKTTTAASTGGKERFRTNSEYFYAYRPTGEGEPSDGGVNFDFTTRKEKHAKLAKTSAKWERTSLRGREMIYFLAESEALHQYAEGALPVSDRKLADALGRWESGELKLPGNVVAGVLTRWTREVPVLPEAVTSDRHALARTLHGRHDLGSLPVRDRKAREQFTEVFERQLDDPAKRREEVPLPEYLTRKDSGGTMPGHSGVRSLTYDSGKSTFDIVREQVDKAAPGLLTADAELWTGDGKPRRRIGGLQGAVQALQTQLAKGRDQALLDDLTSPEGLSFHLVNPMRGALADIVEIRLATKVEPSPKVHDSHDGPDENNFGHAYSSVSRNASRDSSQSVGVTGLGSPRGSGALAGAANVTHGYLRDTTRTDVGTNEQIIRSKDGHYRVEFPQTLTVTVRHLDMAGRPLNNLLARQYRHERGLDEERTVTESGSLVLEVPRGLAEAQPYAGPGLPRDYTPLPPLRDNSYVSGALLDDAVPTGRRLLRDMFGPEADSPTMRSSLVLPALLSRSHLDNHLLEATGKRYQVADNVFLPGGSRDASSDRATLWLRGDLFDLHVIAPVTGSGNGSYTKYQSGTTAGALNDVRMSASVTPSVHAQIATVPAGTQGQPTDGPASSGNGEGFSRFPVTTEANSPNERVTSQGQGSAGTANYRREVKADTTPVNDGRQEEPLLLVRLSGQYRLEAERFHHHLFGDPSPRGTYHSDPINGEVYAELTPAEVEKMRAHVEATRARLAKAPENPRMPAGDRQLFDGAPSFDLGPLLSDAARKGFTAPRAYRSAALAISRQVGGDRPVVLTVDQAAMAQDAYRSVLQWGVRTMRADLAAARTVDPTVETPRSLRLYEGYSGMDPKVLPGTLAGTPDEAIAKIVNEVNRVHVLNPDNPAGAPAPLPPEASLRALDPEYLVRDIAHELDAHVRLDITRQDGTKERRLVEPDGRVSAPEPFTDSPGPGGNSAETAGFNDKRLNGLARETGVHKASGLGGKFRGKLTSVNGGDMRRMRDIVRAGYLFGDQAEAPSTERLTAIRRLADVVDREYGHSGPFRPEHLDPLARDVFGLDADAPVGPGHRGDLMRHVAGAKKSGRRVEAAALRAATLPGGTARKPGSATERLGALVSRAHRPKRERETPSLPDRPAWQRRPAEEVSGGLPDSPSEDTETPAPADPARAAARRTSPGAPRVRDFAEDPTPGILPSVAEAAVMTSLGCDGQSHGPAREVPYTVRAMQQQQRRDRTPNRALGGGAG